MKIKKMNIEYSFTRICPYYKRNLKQIAIKPHRFLFLTNTNDYPKPLINIQERKPPSIHNRSLSCYLPQCLSKHSYKNQHSKIQTTIKKSDLPLQSIKHINERRFLNIELSKLKVIKQKIKGTMKLMNEKISLFQQASFDYKASDLNEKIKKERLLSQPKLKLLDIIINKKGRNKKMYSDNCTQTYEKNEKVVNKNNISKVIDLSLCMSDISYLNKKIV